MFIVVWLGLSILIGIFAGSKNRSGFGWFLLSLIISPIVTFLILLVLGAPKGLLKKCPKCAEEIKKEAEVCRFCGFAFSSLPQTKPVNTDPDLDLLRSRYSELDEKISKCDNASERTTMTQELNLVLDKIQKLS